MQLNRESQLLYLICLQREDFLAVLLGDRVETDDAAVERLVKTLYL